MIADIMIEKTDTPASATKYGNIVLAQRDQIELIRTELVLAELHILL
jgi:hypothetical protein